MPKGDFVSRVLTQESIQGMCAEFFQALKQAGPSVYRPLSCLILNQPQVKLGRTGRPFELWVGLAGHLLEQVGERQPNKVLRRAREIMEQKHVQADSILRLRRGYKKRFRQQAQVLDFVVIFRLFWTLFQLVSEIRANPERFKRKVEDSPEFAALMIRLLCVWEALLYRLVVLQLGNETARKVCSNEITRMVEKMGPLSGGCVRGL